MWKCKIYKKIITNKIETLYITGTKIIVMLK